MANIAVPTQNPGELYIPALGKTFKQVELREDDVFDTVEVYGTALGATGTIAAGRELKFFDTVTNKNEQHTNLPRQGKIQAGDEVAVFRIGLHPREAIGNDLPLFNDYRKVLGNAQLELKFNRRVIASGPAIKFPSGYGMGGFSDETGATAVSVGVPSAAASPTLFVPQQLKDSDDIVGKLRFPDASWYTTYTAPSLGSRMAISLLMHGVMKAPLGK